MSAFYSIYPPISGGSSANASVGIIGDPIPAEATLIGGNDPSGDLRPANVDAQGNLQITIADDQIGIATASNQSIEQGLMQTTNNKLDVLIADGSKEVTLQSIDTKTPALGQAAMAASSPVVIASNQSAVPVSGTVAATQAGTWNIGSVSTISGTVNTNVLVAPGTNSAGITSVAASASSVSLLAANTGRKMMMVFNDSASAILYLKFGTTASPTSYTVQIPAGGYYEMPTAAIYRGAIDGIWSAAVGDARITEY